MTNEEMIMRALIKGTKLIAEVVPEEVDRLRAALAEAERERDEARAQVVALLEVNRDLAADKFTVVSSIQDRTP